MGYEEKLSFTCKLLGAFSVPCQIIVSPETKIPATIDRGLRGALFGSEKYNFMLQNAIPDTQPNTVYRFYDEYSCRYISMKLPAPAGDQYFFIGPYLIEPMTKTDIQMMIPRLGIPDEAPRFLTLYYADLPIIEDENWLLTLARTLAEELWQDPEHLSMEYIDYMIPDGDAPIPITASAAQLMESGRSLETLEENYENENRLMDAVSKGKMHRVTAPAATIFNKGTEPRLHDTLRNRKNYLIVLDTLLRKSAEIGGVHPLHIDKMSSDFSHRIENVMSIRQSLTLQEEMIRQYCLLVKKYSLSKYSFYVGRAITLIHFDLTQDLSLASICDQLNVSRSYFSSLFRKECGCTLTDYVNQQRIDRALILLKTTDKLVQDIATECGFSDTNYFIRLFKRQTGVTPSHYRESSAR